MNIIDSFHFAEEICQQAGFQLLYITSLDIESLFANIPLVESITICVDISKYDFHTLLKHSHQRIISYFEHQIL